jgi:L-iditol 2-dehydrogenase
MSSLPGEMLAGVMTKIREVRFEKWPTPVPGPGEVLVEVRAVGICGSDVHWYADGKLGGATVTEPLVLGHEVAGVVARVGDGVIDLSEGDSVCLEPGIPCGQCVFCRSGRYNICRSLRFYGTPRGGTNHGTFREYLTHPAQFTFKLPQGVDLESGALVEPFSIGIHSCRQAGVGVGQRVLIYGAGPIGLVTLLAARAAGAGEIWVTDPREDRLATARELGASRIIPSSAGPRTVGPGGTVTMVGTFLDIDFEFDLIALMLKEARLTTVWRYVNTYPTALNLIAAGQVDLHPLITHRYPFSQLPEAMEFAREAHPGTIKVIVEFPKHP